MSAEEQSVEVVCPNCQARVNSGGADPHCPKCGAPLSGVTPIDAAPPELEAEPPPEAEAEKPAETVVICPKCGNRQEPDADTLFCDSCGGSVQGVAPVPGSIDDEKTPIEALPTDGVCPDCGGAVAVLSCDRGVCRKCGLKLETPQSRARRFWGFFLLLVLAAAWIAVSYRR